MAAIKEDRDSLPGIWATIKDRRRFKIGSDPSSHIDEIEIGATGPSLLQFVLTSKTRDITITLSAEQARWLGGALQYWADSSDGITTN